MFENYRLIKISNYVARKNKSDSIAVYDVDSLKENKELFISALNKRNISYRYFNGANTDKLFIGVQLANTANKKKFIKFLRAYSSYTGLTRGERKDLNNIRKGYYLSKKYLDEILESEYGLYEPAYQYSDYWENKECSEWDTLGKKVKYEKRLFWEVFPEFSHYKRIIYGEE